MVLVKWGESDCARRTRTRRTGRSTEGLRGLEINSLKTAPAPSHLKTAAESKDGERQTLC